MTTDTTATQTEELPLSRDPKSRWPWAWILLFALTLAAYAPAMLHGSFLWDDNEYITGNSFIKRFDGLYDIWFSPRLLPQYYPLAFSMYFVEYKLWGETAQGYVIVNVLLHLASACMVYKLLKKLNLPGALLGAALFAVHPLAIESVAWIAERKNTLSMFFSLASILAYPGLTPGEKITPGKYKKQIVIATLLFLLALLGKPAAVVVPPMLLAILWWQNGKIRKSDMLVQGFWFLLSMASGILVTYLEALKVATDPEPFNLSLIDRLLISSRGWWFYMGKFAWPNPLSMIYPRWQIDASQPWQYTFVAALLMVIVALWVFRKRFGLAPAVILLLYTVAIGPTLGILNCSYFRLSFVADHFAYWALVPMVAAVGALLFHARTVAVLSHRGATVIACLLVTVLTVVAFDRCRTYSSPLVMWQDAVEKAPRSPGAWSLYGSTLMKMGRLPEAKKAFVTAYELPPHQIDDLGRIANICIIMGELDEAEQYAQKFLAALPKDTESLFLLGLLRYSQKRFDESVEAYLRADQLNPNDTRFITNAGVILFQTGQLPRAIDCFTKSLKRNPLNAKVHNILGQCYVQAGQFPQAVECFEKAVKLSDMPEFKENLQQARLMAATPAASQPQK